MPALPLPRSGLKARHQRPPKPSKFYRESENVYGQALLVVRNEQLKMINR